MGMPTNRNENKPLPKNTIPAQRAQAAKALRVNSRVELAVAKYNAAIEGRKEEREAIDAKERDAAIAALAEKLGFETLETRNSDSADFRSVAVWSLKAALEAA